MLKLTSGIAALLIALSAIAQIEEDPRQAARRLRSEQMERLFAYEHRIGETRPMRRDTPLRYLNIRDGEVREVRAAAQEVYPGEMVYISAVVTGCPCEDGAVCSDQVWVMTNKEALFDGILLSKIDEHWKIGPVQRWWLESVRLAERRKEFKSELAYSDAKDALTLRFPACPEEIDRLMGKLPNVK